MGEDGFPLTRILPYKDIILDSVFIREIKGQWKLSTKQRNLQINQTVWQSSIL